MPVPTAGLADVGAGDPQPLVLRGRGQHVLQQLAVAGLELILLAQGLAGMSDPAGERIADSLELGEIGNARLCVARGYPDVEREAREGLGTQAGELVFQAADLATQLSAREALVASRPQCRQRLSIEQLRHRPGNQCRSRNPGWTRYGR